jgi:hypothetical protein
MPALYNGMSGRKGKPSLLGKRLKIQQLTQICPQDHQINRVLIRSKSRHGIDVIPAEPVKELTASFVSEREITEA